MDVTDITSIAHQVTGLETRLAHCLTEVAALKATLDGLVGTSHGLSDRLSALETAATPVVAAAKVTKEKPL